MRSEIKTALSVVIAFVVVVAATVLIKGQAGGVWKEFTIERIERSVSVPAGNPFEQVVLEAQRADGSRVNDNKTAGVRNIFLVPGGKNVKVNDLLRATTTLYRSSNSTPQPPAFDAQCGFSRIVPRANPLLKGTAEVLGYKAVMIETQEAPYVSTVWKAPDLDCATLKITEDRRDENGVVVGRFETQTLSIKMGTPDPALFDIPTSYSEQSPLEMHKAWAVKKGLSGVPPQCARKSLQQSEQRYRENHEGSGVH
jgi:hypothetical protein